MKNRNDGGYSLALVLVVMAVLATIAVTLTTVVLRNIDNQQKQMERVMAQYEAQGKLEKVLSSLSQNQVVELSGNAAGANHKAALIESVKKLCDDVEFPHAEENAVKFEFTDPDDNGSNFEAPFQFEFSLIAEEQNVEVIYDIVLEGNIAHSVAPSESTLYNYLYIITSPVITHKSVDVVGVFANEGGAE